MKNIILATVVLLTISISDSYAQWSTYTPLTKDEILAPAMIMRQRYDNNAAKVDALIEKIFDLKAQTTDEEFNLKMDKYYNTLKEYYKYDLARMDKEIRDMNHVIMEAVNEYNHKQNNTNRGYESNSNYNSQQKAKNYIGNIEVLEKTPVYDQPTFSNSKTLWWVNNGNTSIVQQIDKNFYQVQDANRKIGYVWIGWFK